jgi:uroporphyrinogen-III synthase
MRVWVTRTKEFAKQTVDLLIAEGLQPLPHPLLMVRALEFKLPISRPSYLLLSSLNAARALVAHGAFKDVPCLVVGHRTARYLLQADFEVEEVFESGDALLCAALFLPRGSRFLHIRGQHVAFEVEEAMYKMGHIYHGVVVYTTDFVHDFAWDDLKYGDVIVFHSVRAVKAFGELLRGALGDATQKLCDIYVVALSKNVAHQCGEKNFKEILVAPHPSDYGVLRSIKALSVRLGLKNDQDFLKKVVD